MVLVNKREFEREKYLVQAEFEEETLTELLYENEVIEMVNFIDFNEIKDFVVYKINGVNKLGELELEKLNYLGWQPMI